MVTGSPGGASIINYVAKTLIATLQDGLDPGQAISLPNIGSRNGPTELERGQVTPALVTALRTRGHETRETEATSGVQSIVLRCPRGEARCAWVGAADPRREGTARGH
jgi:gamma-glutamyltranspeptidase/glutathione hydrolase